MAQVRRRAGDEPVPVYASEKILTVDQQYGNNPVTRYAPPDTDPNKPQPSSRMALELADGKGIVVHDVVHDKTTVSDKTVPNRYFLVGGLDPVGHDSPYSTYYSSLDQSFTIVLYQEPFETTREDAEQDLLLRLGVDKTTACNLKYQVIIPAWASPEYSNQNLGFSFCPGAILFAQ